MMEAIVKLVLKVYFGIFYRVEFVSIDNVPKEGAYVLCHNHLGQMDMFFIAYRLKRLVHFMAKIELFKNPIVGTFLRSVGAYPVKRGTGDISAIKNSLRLLANGRIIGILPEGTRTRGKEMKDIKAKPGAVLIAIKAGVPIIPVAIEGNYKLFSKVRIVYGKPYDLGLDKNKKYTGDELADITADIMKKIYSLLEEK